MNTQFETKHKGNKGGESQWLTPPEIIKSLGEFDLDPCSPVKRPWETAKKHYSILENGLWQDWEGRVWCNPPYGKQAEEWMEKCVSHGNAIALIFARTETNMFFNTVWDKADAVFFIRGRINFYKVSEDGSTVSKLGNAGAPSVLVAYGDNNVEALKRCGLKGKFIHL